MGVSRVLIYSDSQLVTCQVNDSFLVRKDQLMKYVVAFEQAREKFIELILQYNCQEDNHKVDEFAKLASLLVDRLHKILSSMRLN